MRMLLSIFTSAPVPMPVNLGSLSFDDSAVLKQLRSDMKDDWFADPLNYVDMTAGPLLNALIEENFTSNDGQYIPANRHILNLPKPNFTLRYAMETSLIDRFLLHALTAELIPAFDVLLGPAVYNHRYDYSKPGSRYLFKRGIPAWNDFIGSVRSALTDDKYLLSTDLTNCYEGVELQPLKQTLISLLAVIDRTPAEKNRLRLVIEELFRCLSTWAFRNDRGLPQNRDASSFLANMYLHPVDRKMQQLGYGGTYFRYMDDIKVICDNEYLARKALKDLILSLREHGLSVNAKKTVLAAASDKEKIMDCLQEMPVTITYLDSIWKTNKPPLILSKIDELRLATRKVLEEGRFSSKEFRFCMKRLCTLRLCSDFTVPDRFFDEFTPLVIDGLKKAPFASDQIAQYLRVAPLSENDLVRVADFLRDDQKAIYNWQNYHLWIVLTDRRFTAPDLLNHAAACIETGNDTPSRAGASLYSGSAGGNNARERIAKHFSTLTSFQGQRLALIGLHELPFSPMVQECVKPHIRSDLRGVYKQLRERKGHYCNPLDPITLGEEGYEEPES